MPFFDKAKLPEPLGSAHERMVAEAMGYMSMPHVSLDVIKNCIDIVEAAIRSLRGYFDSHPFANIEGEIFFFKVIKPRFYSYRIFFHSAYSIESRRPVGSAKLVRAFLRRELYHLTYFFDTHREFYQYWRSGATHLDQLYFVRGQRATSLAPPHPPSDMDKEFSTGYDFQLATILANEMLRDYLLDEASKLRQKANPPFTSTASLSLTWTAPLSALNELIYALKESGAVNNGNVKIGAIAKGLGILFNIDPGNVYRRELENRIRKERAPFLKKMTKDYLDAKDYNDEHPHGSSR